MLDGYSINGKPLACPTTFCLLSDVSVAELLTWNERRPATKTPNRRRAGPLRGARPGPWYSNATPSDPPKSFHALSLSPVCPWAFIPVTCFSKPRKTEKWPLRGARPGPWYNASPSDPPKSFHALNLSPVSP